MPELPEVETVRRGLEAVLPGRRARSVEVRGKRTARRQGPSVLRRRLEGRTFVRCERRGKYLALVLDSGEVLVVHLRMSGQLLFAKDPSTVPFAPHTHVVVGLDDGSELRFVDPRTFGEWYVTDELGDDGLPVEFDRLGPDPLVDKVTTSLLARRLSGRSSALKIVLTDQRVIAGIGSLYADEICHLARLRPDRLVGGLTRDEIRALSRSMNRLLKAATKERGSSLRDAQYRDLMGELGSYQLRHRVYDRAGQACARCQTTIERVMIGARSAYLCPGCQR